MSFYICVLTFMLQFSSYCVCFKRFICTLIAFLQFYAIHIFSKNKQNNKIPLFTSMNSFSYKLVFINSFVSMTGTCHIVCPDIGYNKILQHTEGTYRKFYMCTVVTMAY